MLQGHDEIVWAVEIDGRRLFSASADKTIRVWDIASRRCEQARPCCIFERMTNGFCPGAWH
jgi:WD40 repeat protein